jgi:hypothetical protein
MHQQRDGTVVVNDASYYMLQLQRLMRYYAVTSSCLSLPPSNAPSISQMRPPALCPAIRML